MTEPTSSDETSRVEIISEQRIFDDFFKIDEAKLKFRKFDNSWSSVVRRLVPVHGSEIGIGGFGRMV